MHLKTKLLMASLVFSSSVLASPEYCGFDDIDGDLVEFVSNDKAKPSESIRSQLPHYRYFTEDQAGEIPLNKSVYTGRKAVFDFKTPTKRKHEGVQKLTFVGYADNCRRVFLQLSESDFSTYFNDKSVFHPNEVNLLKEESTIGMLFHDSELYGVEGADVHPGTYFTLPHEVRPIYFTDKHYQSTVIVDPYVSFDLIETQYIPFSVGGNVLSDVRYKVIYEGKEGYMPGFRGSFSKHNPLLSAKKIHRDAIKQGKLMYGMSLDEVLIAKGLPNATVMTKVVQTPTGRVADTEGTLEGRYKVVGNIYSLTYHDIPYPILIDIKGKFTERKQIFSQAKYRGTLPFMYGE